MENTDRPISAHSGTDTRALSRSTTLSARNIRADISLPMVGRREFLIGGSLMALGCLASHVEAAPGVVVPSIGYWSPPPGSPVSSANALKAPFRADVQAAAGLNIGDVSLADTGVQVSVYGLFGPVTVQEAFVGLNAQYVVEANGVRQLLPFHAWNFGNRAVSSLSGMTRFVIPALRNDGILLSVERKGQAQNASQPNAQMSERFHQIAIAGNSALPKLRRGIYFLPPQRFCPARRSCLGHDAVPRYFYRRQNGKPAIVSIDSARR